MRGAGALRVSPWPREKIAGPCRNCGTRQAIGQWSGGPILLCKACDDTWRRGVTLPPAEALMEHLGESPWDLAAE